MDAYLRNGKDGDVDLDSRFHTGANLVDITANRVLQGALMGDDARIRKALQDQFTVFATVDPYNLQHGVTDGYYADGSFIQHSSVAYTGSYGKALLSRVVQTIKVLDGTEYAQSDDLVGVVQGWVEHGFAPLIFEGWMMEIVKGRAVSRTATGYDDVAVVVEAIVDLADYATGADAARLKSFAKFTARPTINPTSLRLPGQRRAVRRHQGRPGDRRRPTSTRPRAVRRSTRWTAPCTGGPGYAFALARNSERISKYEYMSGENLMPWFQGDGAHYLYLAGQDQTQVVRRRLLHDCLAVRAGRCHRAGRGPQDDPGAVRDAVLRQPAPAELHVVVGVAEHLRVLPDRDQRLLRRRDARCVRRGRMGAVGRLRLRVARHPAGRLRGLPQRVGDQVVVPARRRDRRPRGRRRRRGVAR